MDDAAIAAPPPGRHNVAPRLVLAVTSSGARSFSCTVQWRQDGQKKRTSLGLGRWPATTFDRAVEVARRLAAAREAGADLRAERNQLLPQRLPPKRPRRLGRAPKRPSRFPIVQRVGAADETTTKEGESTRQQRRSVRPGEVLLCTAWRQEMRRLMSADPREVQGLDRHKMKVLQAAILTAEGLAVDRPDLDAREFRWCVDDFLEAAARVERVARLG